MNKNLNKILLFPLIFTIFSCALSPQQSFQNAKLSLVGEIKRHFIGEGETLESINYGEMQYILLDKTNDKYYAANCYYYTGKITLTLSNKTIHIINPTTYYGLSERKGKILDDSIKSFETLKKLIDEDSTYGGKYGTFFPSNYH